MQTLPKDCGDLTLEEMLAALATIGDADQVRNLIARRLVVLPFRPPPPITIKRTDNPDDYIGNPSNLFGMNAWVWRGPADGAGTEGLPQVDPSSVNMNTVDPRGIELLAFPIQGSRQQPLGFEESLAALDRRQTLADLEFAIGFLNEPHQTTLNWLGVVHGVSEIGFLGTVLYMTASGLRGGAYVSRNPDGGLWELRTFLVSNSVPFGVVCCIPFDAAQMLTV